MSREVTFPTTNPDGLVYSIIVFSADQQKKARKPPPERETTDYAYIDFTRMALQSNE